MNNLKLIKHPNGSRKTSNTCFYTIRYTLKGNMADKTKPKKSKKLSFWLFLVVLCFTCNSHIGQVY